MDRILGERKGRHAIQSIRAVQDSNATKMNSVEFTGAAKHNSFADQQRCYKASVGVLQMANTIHLTGDPVDAISGRPATNGGASTLPNVYFFKNLCKFLSNPLGIHTRREVCGGSFVMFEWPVGRLMTGAAATTVRSSCGLRTIFYTRILRRPSSSCSRRHSNEIFTRCGS
ncbi:hypothetical protein T11_9332, partial [Trichinella zimbabwensis]